MWLFASVWPCDELATAPACTPASHPMTAGIGSSPPSDPTEGLSGYRKWMDGFCPLSSCGLMWGFFAILAVSKSLPAACTLEESFEAVLRAL